MSLYSANPSIQLTVADGGNLVMQKAEKKMASAAAVSAWRRLSAAAAASRLSLVRWRLAMLKIG